MCLRLVSVGYSFSPLAPLLPTSHPCLAPLELKKRMGYVADASCVFRNTERDSRKDEAVVFIFIFATAGLLGWAALKPWVAGWIDVSLLLLRPSSRYWRMDKANWCM